MRNEIWSVTASGYASKPRPALIVQSDKVSNIDSVIICLITSYHNPNAPFRVEIVPSKENGLKQLSYAMVDKLVTINKENLGHRIGNLERDTVAKVDNTLRQILSL